MNKKIYVYEIIKLTKDEELLKRTPYKLGLIRFDDTFNGFYHDMDDFDEKNWGYQYVFTEKFLFKLEHDINTTEGKDEFKEKLRNYELKKNGGIKNV